MIDFSRTVTTLVGPSSHGKSAVLRALWWVLTNKPAGKNFIGRWRKAKYALAKATIDGKRIRRIRGASTNVYRLGKQRYKAFGQAVPKRIEGLVNVSPANYQRQIEAPYWFTLSPGEVSTRLNDIINLGSIDRSLSKASAEVRKAKTTKDISAERVHAAREECTKYQWATDFSSQVEEVERLMKKSTLGRLKSSRIASAVEAISGASQARLNAVAGLKLARNAGVWAARWRAMTEQLTELRSLAVQIERSRILAHTPVPSVSKLVKLRNAAVAQRERCRKLAALIFGLDNLRWETKDAKKQLRILKLQAKKVGKRCRTCGQRLPYSAETSTHGTHHHSRAERRERSGTKFRKAITDS